MKRTQISNCPIIVKEVERLLSAGWVLEPGKKHQKICKDGYKCAIPGTPSDYRSSRNWLSQMRKLERFLAEKNE